jgi:hypothetical protein
LLYKDSFTLKFMELVLIMEVGWLA